MIDKYILTLKSLLKGSINTYDELEVWKGQAINILSRIYGEKCKQIEQVKSISYQSNISFGVLGKGGMSGGGNNIDSCRKRAYGLAKNFIEELEMFGAPEVITNKTKDAINITVNQNQSVKVDLNIFLSSLKDELSGKQLNEIKQILESDGDSSNKKTKIIERLKSFGGDVASNILANLITNPQIFGQFNF